jgi:predicted nuclease with TOPRIM domain
MPEAKKPTDPPMAEILERLEAAEADVEELREKVQRMESDQGKTFKLLAAAGYNLESLEAPIDVVDEKVGGAD